GGRRGRAWAAGARGLERGRAGAARVGGGDDVEVVGVGGRGAVEAVVGPRLGPTGNRGVAGPRGGGAADRVGGRPWRGGPREHQLGPVHRHRRVLRGGGRGQRAGLAGDGADSGE